MLKAAPKFIFRSQVLSWYFHFGGPARGKKLFECSIFCLIDSRKGISSEKDLIFSFTRKFNANLIFENYAFTTTTRQTSDSLKTCQKHTGTQKILCSLYSGKKFFISEQFFWKNKQIIIIANNKIIHRELRGAAEVLKA